MFDKCFTSIPLPLGGSLGTCRSGANDQHRQLQPFSARRFQGLRPEAPRRRFRSGGRGHEAGEAADTWGAGKTWSVLWDFMGFYGILWDFMGFYGISWDFMGFYGKDH